jgi:hypothetical protein
MFQQSDKTAARIEQLRRRFTRGHGRKRVTRGHTTFIFDESRLLLASLDLPINGP